MESLQYLSSTGQKLQSLCESNQFTSIDDALILFREDANKYYESEVKRIQEFNLANGRELNRSVNKAGIFHGDNLEKMRKFFNIIFFKQLKDIIRRFEIPTFFETNDSSTVTHETMLNNIVINMEEVQKIKRFSKEYEYLSSYFDWIFLKSLKSVDEVLLK